MIKRSAMESWLGERLTAKVIEQAADLGVAPERLSREQLMAIKGIGPKKADLFLQMAAVYRRPDRRRARSRDQVVSRYLMLQLVPLLVLVPAVVGYLWYSIHF